jgi:hypothetical protein
LETLRLSNGGYLEEVHHQSCETERCEIDSVSNLQINMRLYLNELQRVFFKKENMRSKETWWLSAFYSLVIQGFVRRALLKVARKWTLWTVRDESEANDYLQVAVRLFIASSGTYDPLMRDYATFGKEKESKTDKHRLAEDFQAAQLSLHQYKWVSSGTPCTADYLRNLYEIDLEPVDERSLQSTPQRSPRVTPLSLGWTPEYERLYKFVVQKGNEPYFELLPGCLITQHTPERVYLDAPRSVYFRILPGRLMLTLCVATPRETNSPASTRVLAMTRFLSDPQTLNGTTKMYTLLLTRKTNIRATIDYVREYISPLLGKTTSETTFEIITKKTSAALRARNFTKGRNGSNYKMNGLLKEKFILLGGGVLNACIKS